MKLWKVKRMEHKLVDALGQGIEIGFGPVKDTKISSEIREMFYAIHLLRLIQLHT